MKAIKLLISLVLVLSSVSFVWAQQTLGELSGIVQDAETGELMTGATVTLVGTYLGAYADDQGKYVIKNIKPGEYTIRVTYISYAEKQITGVKVFEGKSTLLNVKMVSAEASLGTVVIEGERNMIDLESGRSEVKIGQDQLRDMNTRDVQSVAALQAGITRTPDGLQIRGSRIYETQYLIDGINASDKLAGTGFGVDVNTSAVQEVHIITGGAGPEFGDGTSGVVATKIREGSNSFKSGGAYLRDNFRFGTYFKSGTINPEHLHSHMSWNTDIFNMYISGPIRKDKLFYFFGTSAEASDEFMSNTLRIENPGYSGTAKQLNSSIISDDALLDDEFWAPRQDNKWSSTAKISWNIKSGMKLSFTQQNSLNINQNTRSLQIIGNDAIMTPGFQYSFSQNLDNATTYTHRSSLTVLNYKWVMGSQWAMDITLGRSFINLRADANGRPFRESTISGIYDPASIVTDPVSVFNPNDSVVYVFPGPGLINNGGISTLWHDHYASEYTFRPKFSWMSLNKIHYMSFGWEHIEQSYQWADITRPWIGAPIQVNDTLTIPSTRLGTSSDVWRVNPATGGLFYNDQIRYKGIIADLGMRFMYWAPGSFADQSVLDPNAPVTQGVRDQYNKQTVTLGGRSYKARILPRLNVTFPVSDNQTLYFNYAHATRLPHPRFVYAGLDPYYQNRSFLANLGNPAINPEVSVSYEVGLKQQLTSNLVLELAAFYKDQYDFIVSRSLLIQDYSGRLVTKNFYINQDYARIRGLELTLNRRVNTWLRVNANVGYQIATGKSNTAAESALQIRTTGNVTATKEQYLAWDRPLDIKLTTTLKSDTSFRVLGVPLTHFRVFLSATWKSGLRYTPVREAGQETDGRPIYEFIPDQPYAKVGSAWFWTDLKVSKDISLHNRKGISITAEIRNIFNNRNAAIVNPVTGKGYRKGDPLPNTFRDPNYPNPRDFGAPPFDPARWLEPRHFLFGIMYQFG